MTKDQLEQYKKDNPPSAHLNGKFEVVGVLPGVVQFGRQTVDLRKVSLEDAEKLYQAKFPYLKKVEKTTKQA